MFQIFRKKNVDPQTIKNFNEVLKTIDIFIRLSEWEKAKMALKEIRIKEKQSLTDLMIKIEKEDKIFGEKEVDKQNKLFKKKLVRLDKLEDKLIKNEMKLRKQMEKKKFQIRFKTIKHEIETLTWWKRFHEATNLLQKFLEENKDKGIVIKFFNKEKKIILKKSERQQKIDQEKIKRNTKNEALNLIWESINIEIEEKQINFILQH